jgi:hypothetical protein
VLKSEVRRLERPHLAQKPPRQTETCRGLYGYSDRTSSLLDSASQLDEWADSVLANTKENFKVGTPPGVPFFIADSALFLCRFPDRMV